MLNASLRRCLPAPGFALGALLAVACAAAAAPLPVETFFKRPQYGTPELSPSGRYLAVTTPVNGRLNVSVIDLDNKKAVAITSFTTADVFAITWLTDDRMVITAGDLQRGTGEPPRYFGIFAVNRDASQPMAISKRFAQRPGTEIGFERIPRVRFVREIPGINDVLLASNDRSEDSLDLYRYDTLTGQKKLLSFDSPGNVSRWIADFDGVPRAAVSDDLRHDKSAIYVRGNASDGWQQIEEAALDRLKSTPLGFSPDGKTLYIESRRDGDRDELYEYDVASKKWTVLAKHPERDIDARFVSDLKERKLFGFTYEDDKPGSVWFDPDWARMQKSVDAALPDTVNLLQRRGDRWIVVAYSDRDPGEVYLLDDKTMKMERLFSYEPDIHPSDMAPMRWVRYKARDGLVIPALLTVPRGAEGKRVPLIVHIHGGPNVPTNSWGYNPEVQFLASRGYAVLQPQFRGTEGFGWKLESAGFRKWGDEMQDDLEDGVKWAVAQGIADPDRVCFFGASYGGYASAWGAIKNAKLIKCAVDYVGVTSIDYLFDNAQTDLSELAEKSTLMAEHIGDPKTERERFKRVNPLDNADKVGVPILLAYGALDLRVPIVHGTAFRAALDKYNKPYEWVVYAEEGHGFNKDDNLFDFWHRVERFLAKYLGPAPASAAAH
ncbi:MAG TPA: S9 family peptidase [Casimicrobiaceae bacterium]|nr:S9 family peptidase [Casimicrobiaceae bacterium]